MGPRGTARAGGRRVLSPRERRDGSMEVAGMAVPLGNGLLPQHLNWF